MASGKLVPFLIALTVFAAALFVTKQLFDRVTDWRVAPVPKRPVVKPYREMIKKPLPPPGRDLSINLVIVPYLHFINFSDEAVNERKKEYWTALQRNLNHQFVSHVHVLTTNARETLQCYNHLTNQNKLIVSEVNSVDSLRDAFDYISKNLVDKDVAFTNADIYLGGGFDRVDPKVLSNRNIMYALTRRSDPEQKEKCHFIDPCVDKTYFGSHDTFLFHLTEPLPEEALKYLEIKLPALGMENQLLWVFQKLLNYCTLNPCTILETFHLHCSRVRNVKPKRVGLAGHSGKAGYTTNLVC